MVDLLAVAAAAGAVVASGSTLAICLRPRPRRTATTAPTRMVVSAREVEARQVAAAALHGATYGNLEGAQNLLRKLAGEQGVSGMAVAAAAWVDTLAGEYGPAWTVDAARCLDRGVGAAAVVAHLRRHQPVWADLFPAGNLAVATSTALHVLRLVAALRRPVTV